MPCSKYKGKQRAACYATNEWSRPTRSQRPVRKKRKPKAQSKNRKKTK